MDIETVRSVFTWCTILNGGLLAVSALICSCAGDWLYRVQSRRFPISREAFNVAIYSFIGAYKIFFLTFNLVPWIALQLAGS